MAILFTLWVFARNLLRESLPKKYFFILRFIWECLTWGLNRDLTPNKSVFYVQDYGDFIIRLHTYIIHNWLDLNVDSERQIFKKLSHGRFIYSQSFCQKSAERKSPKKYFSYFIFDDWPGIRTQTFASNKQTHYILDHGDFRLDYLLSIFSSEWWNQEGLEFCVSEFPELPKKNTVFHRM